MGGKYRSRADKPEHRYSEAGRFLITVGDSRLILSHRGKRWYPPTDVYETHDSIVVKVEVAGMSEDDFTITYSDRSLIVAGTRRDPTVKLGYHQMEISYGEFRTDVYVSVAVDVDGIEATYTDGFLLVTLPKEGIHRVVVDDE